MKKNLRYWQLWIDTGGTFTDCISIGPQGHTTRIKVLSSSRLRARILKREKKNTYLFEHNWPVEKDIFLHYSFCLLNRPKLKAFVKSINFDTNTLVIDRDLDFNFPSDFEITTGEEAPILAARLATQTPLSTALPPIDMRLGTTKGTNALLEKKGAKVCFLTTKGFKDLMAIGTQQRPNLFQLDIPDPNLLYSDVLEVDERINAKGEVLRILKDKEIERIIIELKKKSPEAIAIALLNAFKNPEHELRLIKALEKNGFQYCSYSEGLAPSIKLLPRAQTTLVNAYLHPVLQSYLQNIQTSLGPKSNLLIMTSSGGLVTASSFNPKDSLLSGPAGGVVGAAQIARQLGFPRIITLDMGGTSTDTARYDSHYDYHYRTKVEDIEISSPALVIETVAAGGGSICSFDGHKLCVGPESAGAFPGPACYGAGGPLTITDVNLLLGKLDPKVIGIPIQKRKASEALQALQKEIKSTTDQHYDLLELLRGFESIANEKMAGAIKRISVGKGFNPSGYALLAFGGAGGLHACQIATELNISTILLPFDGGLLSAYGMGQAKVERFSQQQILQPLEAVKGSLPELIINLGAQSISFLEQEGFFREQVEINRSLVYLRLKGQESAVEITFTNIDHLEKAFKTKYIELFGYFPASQSIEVESIKVIASTKSPKHIEKPQPSSSYFPKPNSFLSPPINEIESMNIPVYIWETLENGAQINGPAILLNTNSTAFIEPSWQLKIVNGGQAILKQNENYSKKVITHKKAIELELFMNRFAFIAEEMGAQLQRTAFSVNIKERLDFSCALLTPKAELLINAPHIPVHLGSLGICARLVLEHHSLEPGDVIITNHPKYGGSHLPDVTLMSSVFTDEGQLIGYVINRAHHAEIGGKTPGSMPPDAQTLEEEGVCIFPTYLIKSGKPQWEIIEKLLLETKYPTRSLSENLADINAALAALQSGANALQGLVKEMSLSKVHYYMEAIKIHSYQALQTAIINLEGKSYEAIEHLDDGHQISVKANFQKNNIEFDFQGTSPTHPNNLNANLSIVHSAIIYVLRLLCNKPIPLNEGLMKDVYILLPESFLNPKFEDTPQNCPAVVGGNTEVSQRLVDTLLKAFKLAACSQGTMNNFLFGNQHFGYYETIGGGAGAGPNFPGRSAVHQHMTNTSITDPEELEHRYPVLLNRFAIRAQSGGNGKYKGGNGIIREITFLAPLDITILSQHRKESPYGLEGGEAGSRGRQYIILQDEAIENLEGISSRSVQAGDRFIIETPGGGGFGRP